MCSCTKSIHGVTVGYPTGEHQGRSACFHLLHVVSNLNMTQNIATDVSIQQSQNTYLTSLLKVHLVVRHAARSPRMHCFFFKPMPFTTLYSSYWQRIQCHGWPKSMGFLEYNGIFFFFLQIPFTNVPSSFFGLVPHSLFEWLFILPKVYYFLQLSIYCHLCHPQIATHKKT